MPQELSREEFKRGTRHVVMGGAAFGLLLAIVLVWALWPEPPSGPETTKRQGLPAQTAGESRVAKSGGDSSGLGGGGARNIEKSAMPLELSARQLDQLRSAAQSLPDLPAVDQADFELMVGAAVPAKTPRKPLPPQMSQILGGYTNDSYLFVGRAMIIVDDNAGRVGAIIPDIRG